MKLWDDEVEALRPAIRNEAAEYISMAVLGTKGAGGSHSELVVARMIDGPGGGLRLRTFTPQVWARAVLLHLHGGGWFRGRPEMADPANEMLAKERGIAVVSVDYRLAPEHRFPAGPVDCEAAALWLLQHAESEFGATKLLIGGESAGAHLAVLTLLRLRDHHAAIGRFVGANIVFGFFDFGHLPSHQGLNGGPDILDFANLDEMANLVLPGFSLEERRAPQHSPLWADLGAMPPALFTVGLNDHLSDDTLLLASRWERAGNQAELLAYPDAPHGCTTTLPSVRKHWTPRMHAFLDRCLSDD